MSATRAYRTSRAWPRARSRVSRTDLVDATVAQLFPDANGALTIARSFVSAADTSTTRWAAELVRSETGGMLQTDLKPVSVSTGVEPLASTSTTITSPT